MKAINSGNAPVPTTNASPVYCSAPANTNRQLCWTERQDWGALPVALVGKTCCQVDAQYGPVERGELLTTSPTPGLAMRATEPVRAFGAVIGKALRLLKEGRGLIPILVALQ
jgi:hypothetical protein